MEGLPGTAHGTPDYCVRVALKAKALRLGLTHHDPNASDIKIDAIVAEAGKALEVQAPDQKLLIFACKDYQEVEL